MGTGIPGRGNSTCKRLEPRKSKEGDVARAERSKGVRNRLVEAVRRRGTEGWESPEGVQATRCDL